LPDLGFGLLATLLILTGATIGAVLTYLASRSRQTSQLTLELIQRNEKSQFDALEFLESAWPPLAEAGFTGLHWHANWYGGERWGGAGVEHGTQVKRTLEASEIQICVSLTQPAMRGENRYFCDALAATFFLLLQCDLWVKAGSVAAATAELSRFSLFLRHDMKNYAQYIELLDDQVRACPPEQASALLGRLQRTTPVLRDRASAILRSLQGDASPSVEGPIALAATIGQAASLYGIACEISGNDGYTAIPPSTLDTVLDNLLKNYTDLARRKGTPTPTLVVALSEQSTHLRVTIEDPQALAVAHLERLFEPFWSDHPNGLGIGLYQSRQALLAVGGSLAVEATSSGAPRFVLHLPAATTAV
jgi:signal transduction histidine kinase